MNTFPLSNEENEQEFAVDFPMTNDPFADDGFLNEFPDYPYNPADDPFVPSAPVESAVSVKALPTEPNMSDGGWAWHDSALVGVERVDDVGTTHYEVGCVDLYANTHSGDLGGNYLRVNSFDDVDAAANYYHDLQRELDSQRLLPFQIAEFAARKSATYADGRSLEAPTWTPCGPTEYAAYDEIRLPDGSGVDTPPTPALQNLLDQVAEMSGVTSRSTDTPAVNEQASTFQALHNIGIQAEGFDPDKDPPPFFDEATNTAYWIGVFQPDRHDSSNCVASILSLARDPKTGDVEALLAPCVPGDWNKAYQACEHLLDAVEKGGIERCFDTAEGMALAADQRELWQKEHGLSLESDAAQELADYTRSAWEIEL